MMCVRFPLWLKNAMSRTSARSFLRLLILVVPILLGPLPIRILRLWPIAATLSVIAEMTVHREVKRRQVIRLVAADCVIAVLSVRVLWFAIMQMQTHADNLAWIEALSLGDYISSLELQVLMGAWPASILMVGLILAGLMRSIDNMATRLSLYITCFSILVFKAADYIHPIISDYTLHWCATFTVLLASAALNEQQVATPKVRSLSAPIAAAVVLFSATTVGLVDLQSGTPIPIPQDFRYTVRTVARAARAALLVSHESMGLVVTQSCMLEFHRRSCPFPLVVTANPAQSDSWAFGGYDGPITEPEKVRLTLGSAQTVYAFSRYVYNPLDQIGMNPGKYPAVKWSDGELTGPIPIEEFRSY